MKNTRNSRGIPEDYLISEHAKLSRLKEVAQHTYFYTRYLSIEDIPAYPRPEFHVSKLKHDTQRQALLQIRKDKGFKDPCGGSSDPLELSLVWWSLAVGTEEIKEAEARLLKKTYPKQTEEQAAKQQSFLWRFATSPAFSEKSIFGSYRFTFTVEEVLEAYSNQFCSGAPPIMRVLKTSVYKKEVVHVVLVHSPANQEDFSKYPLLPRDDPDAVCAYRDKRFIWRPEAMCKTHRYKLIPKPNENQMAYEDQQSEVFYVWDNVAIALHVEKGQVLKFDCDLLMEKKVTFCPQSDANVPSGIQFDNFKAAEALVKHLWPDSGFQLKEELSLEQHFKEEPKEEPMEIEDSQQ